MTIREWIANPSDYNTGLQLYIHWGSHGNLKKILERGGDTSANRENLFYEMSKLVGKDEQPVPVHSWDEEPLKEQKKAPAPKVAYNESGEKLIPYDPEKEKAIQEPEKVVTEAYKFTPPELLELEAQWKDLYKRSAHLQARLEDMKTDTERCQAAHEILNNFDTIEELWEKVDHFKATGTMLQPKIVQVETNTVEELLKRKKNLASYISHAENGSRYRHKDNIPKWKLEIEEINKQLQKANQSL